MLQGTPKQSVHFCKVDANITFMFLICIYVCKIDNVAGKSSEIHEIIVASACDQLESPSAGSWRLCS